MEDPDICREVLSLFFSPQNQGLDIQGCKRAVCRKHHLPAVPKNSALLASAGPEDRELLRRLLLVKPTRTLSGVAPVAVMTSPFPCPHGKCLPCPGGPDHAYASPQSYTGEEPAALRAREHGYDPYAQVSARLAQFELLGHRVDKVELIVMGGTMTARPAEYQEWFVREAVRAMNDYSSPHTGPGIPDRGNGTDTPGIDGPEVYRKDPAIGFPDVSGTNRIPGVPGAACDPEPEFLRNESAAVRCVSLAFETRPDWCREGEIARMLSLGVTRVELGVQHTDDRILALNRRGCTTEDAVAANRKLRDAGMKVGFHMMPNLPGSTPEKDIEMFSRLFSDPGLRPDFLKIYPALVTSGTEIEELWREGRYEPYPEEVLVDLIAEIKSLLPPYVRLQRVQRDIPARLIVAGSRHSNFRQLAQVRLLSRGGSCSCIRCREIGRRPTEAVQEARAFSYECAGGMEHFLSVEAGNSLVGFARLRTGGDRWYQGTGGVAFLRELHVYGGLVPIGAVPHRDEAQHRSAGNRLLRTAEETAAGAGHRVLAVMAGVGVRPWYRRHAYRRVGPYMVKELA
jgi:elongator complex protein 3